MIFKPADIILVQSGKMGYIIAWILETSQGDSVDYSHAMLATSEDRGIEARTSIRRVDLTKALKKVKRYIVIRRLDLTDKQRLRIIKKANRCLHQKYSYKRLVIQLFDQMFKTNYFTRKLKFKKHICSTLVSWAYYVTTGIVFNGVHWKSVEPDDLIDEAENNPDFYQTWSVG